MYKSIALVDVSCLFKRIYEANPGSGAHNTLAELTRIRERAEHMILCLDAPPYVRRERFAAYKANRSAPEPSELYQKRWLYDQCKAAGFQMARYKGAEGDDVIATLARIYGESCPDVWLVGADKDLAQCVTDNVRQLVPQHGERPEHFRGPKEVKEKYGVWPSQIPLWLALVGDKGDNVPGVPGVGPVKAEGLIAEYGSLTGIAENLGRIGGKIGASLAQNWEQLVLSLELTTLDSHVPLDADALLDKLEPVVPEQMAPKVELEFDGFMGNAPPMPEPNPDLNVVLGAAKPEPIIGKDPRADEFLRQEAEARASMRNADRAALEQHEKEQKREQEWREQRRRELSAVAEPIETPPPPSATGKVAEAEFDPIGKSPGASGPMPPRPQPPAESSDRPGLAKTKPAPEYGVVTADLQPQDLRSAEVIAKWVVASGLYPQFKSPAAAFVVIMRGKELGIGVTTALTGFNVLGNKLVATADMIRSLATRSPKCKYLRRISCSDTEAEWETQHADHPAPTRFKYTIEQARRAGNRGGNWEKIPMEMLSKTAASKLAREVYPAETLGLYCPEEMGDYVDTVGEAA